MSKYEHILLPELSEKLNYSPRQTGGGKKNIPERDRTAHATYLQERFDTIWTENEELISARSAIHLPTRNGTYIEFKGAANRDLLFNSLEASSSGVRLLNVRILQNGDNFETLATVYVPKGKENVFIKKIQDYADTTKDVINEKKGTSHPKNADLVNSIEDIKLALVKSFWTDSQETFPTNKKDWYEIWIKIDEKNEIEVVGQINAFKLILDNLGVVHKGNYLHFPERAVVLAYVNDETLKDILFASDHLAEVKLGKETASFWFNEYPADQREWVNDILNRLVINNHTEVSVCILDSGINNGHQLISPLLSDDNCLKYDPQWDVADRRGHGTQMAGVVAYGDLTKALLSSGNIDIAHTLCSVKILPNQGLNPKELWGEITKESVYRSEIQLGNRRIIYCMAITDHDNDNLGKPTSWSGAIDNISYGEDAKSRLMIVSAGNIDPNNIRNSHIWDNYPDGNLLRPVQDPAQSWNALTVGAYTEKILINDHRFDEFQRVAPSGGLSPFSTTSTLWKKSTPIKPEILFEGGNLIKTNSNERPYDNHDSLDLLTTHHNLQIRQFDTINATSAATALAANFAAKVVVRYPNLWPESVRGLMIHSARWTETMERQFPVRIGNGGRDDMKWRLKCCGYGVPNEERALYSTENGFTFIAQEKLKPYIKDRAKSNIKINQMHFYDLPWPKELLEGLGEIEVTLRITLSYFIEPSPGEIGWKDKYRYPSYGLRFDVNTSTETEDDFKRRINRLILEEDEEEAQQNDSQRWEVGSSNRNEGSVHSDSIKITGAQLSTCNLIAVYPLGGWWKTRPNLKRFGGEVKYSLIISLDTPDETIDLYNIVKTQVDTLIQNKVEVVVPIN